MDVVLDVNTPPLNGLTINGKLSFANNKDLELTTEWIMAFNVSVVTQATANLARRVRLL